jgi:hypothetical protein
LVACFSNAGKSQSHDAKDARKMQGKIGSDIEDSITVFRFSRFGSAHVWEQKSVSGDKREGFFIKARVWYKSGFLQRELHQRT